MSNITSGQYMVPRGVRAKVERTVLNKVARYVQVQSEPVGLFIPKKVHDAIAYFQKLGFLLAPESYVLFQPEKSQKGEEYNSFHIVFDENSEESGLKSFLVVHVLDLSKPTQLGKSVLVDSETLSVLGTKRVFYLNDFEKTVSERFEGYDIEPVNGMGFMYYLDLLTERTHSWSDAEIRILDQYVTDGYSLNAILNLLNKKVAVKLMEDFLNLPASWVERAFPSKKKATGILT